jgi:hypothetical protein
MNRQYNIAVLQTGSGHFRQCLTGLTPGDTIVPDRLGGRSESYGSGGNLLLGRSSAEHETSNAFLA